jgi:glycosyltransferase involved in cell wall biosynthesis
VGDYLPRKCGIATFTTDILAAVAHAYPDHHCFALAVNDIQGGYDYPETVRFEIEEQDLSSYLRAADFLNIGNVDVVCVQHEFGIYGGPAGSHLLALLRELRMPVVTTLHTVLKDPSPEQRRVMDGLIALSTRLVVMAERGRQMLMDVYRVPAAQIDLIPHGIPDVEFADAACFKKQFGVEGRLVLLTFGLLSPNKGIEYVLNALPRIVAEFPEVVYIVLGATHPGELREHGQAYRLSLEMLARKNKVDKNVIFCNQFVDLEDLKQFIGAADIYITPYLNEAQITSGTLAYTFGSGKVVVSTPYWHAAELLAEGRGVLVPFGDADAIAREVAALLADEPRRDSMRRDAYRIGREMVWSNVGRMYGRSFETALETAALPRKSLTTMTLDRKPRELPAIDIGHLLRMTDSTGIYQHALFSVPDFSEGHCTDDNARAFILAILLEEAGEHPDAMRTLATATAGFLNYAFDAGTGRFHSHLSFDRQWRDSMGSEDCHARAVWALGTGVRRSRTFRSMANRLFVRAMPALTGFTSPRAWAFGLIGIDEYLHRMGGDCAVQHARDTLVSLLMGRFEASARAYWQWFEHSLTYDNAKLAHALILSGNSTGRKDVAECGLKALRWLVEVQTSDSGCFSPVGSNGFYRRGGERAHFDQQPVEAQATVSACLAACRATSDAWWHEQAQRAFDWFIGRNDLGLGLYFPETGGCADGLHPDRINENQGAESTLAFLLALTEMRSSQDLATSLIESAA